ncbi:MAG: hypothetical protein AAB688_00885 [Patescibacteria group bacterium]
MKNLKSIIMGIMIVFCLLTPLKIALGLEVIPPVQVSEQSLEVKKITEKKKEKGEKYYFYYLETREIQSTPLSYSGIIKADKDETPDQVFKRVLMSNEKEFRCSVVIIQFNKIE